MIELPDNHAYVVIRVNDKANGEKMTSIIACYNQLSKANARASDEMSVAFTNHPSSKEENKPRARLVEDRYFAFAEFDSPASAMRGDRIELKVKKLPVQNGLVDTSTKRIPKSKSRGSILGMEFQTDIHAQSSENIYLPATMPLKSWEHMFEERKRMSEASILSVRRRVESEINKVPVDGYLSKYEWYQARQEDIDALISSTNTANTFLGATLRFYQTKRMKVAAATIAAAAAATSQACQNPVDTPPEFLFAGQKMIVQPANRATTSLHSPPQFVEDGPECPVSPLSLNDGTAFAAQRSLTDIEQMIAGPNFETSLSKIVTMSPMQSLFNRSTNPSAMPLTPPASRRSSKIEEFTTIQRTTSPRENRFLRPHTPVSPRRSHISSPKRTRSPRRNSNFLSPTYPMTEWTRDMKTQENTNANRGRSPLRGVRRQPRDSLDTSFLEPQLLPSEVVDSQAEPVKVERLVSQEPEVIITIASDHSQVVQPPKRRQNLVEDSESHMDLHAAKVAKTSDTAKRRGSCVTISLGSLTDSMASLSAENSTLFQGKKNMVPRTRGTRSRGGLFRNAPVTRYL